MIKGQDIVVLAALMSGGDIPRSYAPLAKRTKLSVSETYAAVKRLQEARLIDEERHLQKRNTLEFLTHAVRYLFPPATSKTRPLVKGIPTGYAAPIAADEFAISGAIPVWPCVNGESEGRAFEPIYSSVPLAASEDPALYNTLATIDMLRGGRARERAFAEKILQEAVK